MFLPLSLSPSVSLSACVFSRSLAVWETRVEVRENNWMGLPHKIHSETSWGIRMRNCPAQWIKSIWSITRSLSQGFPFCLCPGLCMLLDKCVCLYLMQHRITAFLVINETITQLSEVVAKGLLTCHIYIFDNWLCLLGIRLNALTKRWPKGLRKQKIMQKLWNKIFKK